MVSLEIESRFMSEFWDFRKKYHDNPDWENLIKDSDALIKKYDDVYFFQLIMVCVDDIARRNKDELALKDPLKSLYEELRKR